MPRTVKAACLTSPRLSPIVWESPVKLGRRASYERPTLLWIDDFEPGLALYRAMFEGFGFQVLTATSGAKGIRLAAMNRVDVAVTDYEMPGMDGEAVAASIKTLNPKTPVILFSGSALVPLRARRVVDAFCDKAGSRNQLLATIHRLLHKKRTRSLQPPPVARASHQAHRTVA
jgi:CheY-like chemotaxis protein